MVEATTSPRAPRRFLAASFAILLPAAACWLFWRTTPPVGGYLQGHSSPGEADRTGAGLFSLAPEEIYAQRCSACHGADLSGGRGVALKHPNWPYAKNRNLLIHVISEGRGLGMQPFRGKLSQQQIEGLADWLQSMNPAPGGN